jgi:multicomponent K+:H+ antiporter subunit E
MRRLFPRPRYSLLLAAFWLLLMNQFSLGQGLLALALGVSLPLLTARFAGDARPVARWGKALRLAALFAYDVIVANLTVAGYVLGIKGPVKPAFVEVKLDMKDSGVIALLAGMVTLTPGTVSVDIDRARGVLLVHALVADDAERIARDIKFRYESRLKEIFRC